MISAVFTIQPLSIPLNEVAISAAICKNNSNNVWNVTVVLSEPPTSQREQELIQGSEIEAQVIGENGTALKLVERPSGLLPKTGGGLGSATSAPFQFQYSEDRPKQLIVTYHGQIAKFDIVPGENNQATCK